MASHILGLGRCRLHLDHDVQDWMKIMMTCRAIMIRERLTKAHKSDGGQVECFQAQVTEEAVVDGWVKRPYNQDYDSGVV